MSDFHYFPFSLKRDGPASHLTVNLHSFVLHNRLLCCFVGGGGVILDINVLLLHFFGVFFSGVFAAAA